MGGRGLGVSRFRALRDLGVRGSGFRDLEFRVSRL